MKRLVLSLMVLSLLALGGQSFAELCTIDDVPAATLLLPYFEVDLDNADGVDTLFSINNASAAPALAHVTLWTDWSHPTIDFDIFLTGYDVQSVSMRNVFNGNLPITAHDATDGGDSISPHGNNPGWDGDFNGCTGILPYPANPVVTGVAMDRLVNGHTGNVVASTGTCFGYDHGDNVARGYITIDNVNECSLDFPGDAGYFVDGGIGVASNVNQLWGDWFIIDGANDFATGDNLVHIEADDAFNAGSTPTNYTFYGRYTTLGEDNREPLSTTWGVRYLNGGAFDGGTDLIVWRDSTYSVTDEDGYPGCGGPPWYPLNETEVVAFDEEEDAVEICFFEGGIISPPQTNDPACFPLETQRAEVGTAPLDLPYDFGWLYLNLNIPNDSLPVGTDVDFGTAEVAQSYVAATHSALNRFSVGLDAISLTSACEDLSPSIADNWTIPQY